MSEYNDDLDLGRHITRKNFSLLMQEILVDHVDGWAPWVQKAPGRQQASAGLAARGLITIECGPTGKPIRSKITDDGRAALAALLAQYVEALTKAVRGREDSYFEKSAIRDMQALRAALS